MVVTGLLAGASPPSHLCGCRNAAHGLPARRNHTSLRLPIYLQSTDSREVFPPCWSVCSAQPFSRASLARCRTASAPADASTLEEVASPNEDAVSPPVASATLPEGEVYPSTGAAAALENSAVVAEGEEDFYDVDDAAPAPCFEGSGSWSATHLKKAQRLRQHDSRPGSQSLASRVRDVIRRPALEDIARLESRFPFEGGFHLEGGRVASAEEVIRDLGGLALEGRVERLAAAAAARTFRILPIVEGLYDMGNLAAVCRTSDALGIGSVHVVNSKGEKYKQSARTSGGAEKWLDVRLWRTSTDAILAAKAAGYRVVATHLRADAVDVRDVDWSLPTAVVLGNERAGVSAEVVAQADQCVVIPMMGFVESYNVSVAAALTLYEARCGHSATAAARAAAAVEQQSGAESPAVALMGSGCLTAEEQRVLVALMLLRQTGQSTQVLQALLDRPPMAWQSHKKWKFD